MKPIRSRTRASGRKMQGPPPEAQKYTGPIRVLWNKDDMVVTNIVLSGRANVGTDAMGNGSTALVYDGTVIPSQDAHVAFASLYEEYRVLGIRLEFKPKLANADFGSIGIGVGNAVADPVVIAPFRETNTSFTNLQMALTVGGCVSRPANQSVSKEIKADESDLMQWTEVANEPAELFGLKTWMALGGASASDTVNLGTWIATYLVQYRTRRDPSATFAKQRVVVQDVRAERKEEAFEMAAAVKHQQEPTLRAASAQPFLNGGPERYVLVRQQDPSGVSIATPAATPRSVK